MNMSNDYISIQDASDVSNKSIQTIRRAIKSKKLKVRRQKTPQGFNYLIEKLSLSQLYRLNLKEETAKTVEQAEVKKTVEEKSVKSEKAKKLSVDPDDFKNFVKTLETMMVQHNDERQNFLRLINTLQEKVFVLENQLNLLKAPAEKKWFNFWK